MACFWYSRILTKLGIRGYGREYQLRFRAELSVCLGSSQAACINPIPLRYRLNNGLFYRREGTQLLCLFIVIPQRVKSCCLANTTAFLPVPRSK
jgi:hypothetical protein